MSDLECGCEKSRAPTVERSLDRKYLVRRVATAKGMCEERFLDEHDQAIVDVRMELLDTQAGPRVGDFVVFADGAERRISYAWPAGERIPACVQTSDGGRWYLGLGGLSFSGSLHPGVSEETLTDTGETREGDAWIFHHDWHRAHNGVDFKVRFRVYRCSMPADEAERSLAAVIA